MFLCFQQNKRCERGGTQDLFRTTEEKRRNSTVEWKRYSYCTTYLYNREKKKHAGWHKNILLTTDYECSIKAEQGDTHRRSEVPLSCLTGRLEGISCMWNTWVGGSKSSSKLSESRETAADWEDSDLCDFLALSHIFFSLYYIYGRYFLYVNTAAGGRHTFVLGGVWGRCLRWRWAAFIEFCVEDEGGTPVNLPMDLWGALIKASGHVVATQHLCFILTRWTQTSPFCKDSRRICTPRWSDLKCFRRRDEASQRIFFVTTETASTKHDIHKITNTFCSVCQYLLVN